MNLSSVCSIKPAVITPYCNEDISIINRCICSVAKQAYAAKHFLVADGKIKHNFSGYDIEHLILSGPHRDYGNTPRCIGSLSAINKGYNAICFLDADNWYEPNHIEEAIKMKIDKIETDVVASLRRIILPEDIEAPIDPDEVTRDHVDTSCMTLFEDAFSILPLWATMTTELSSIGDRVIFRTMKHRKFNIEYTNKKTVNYFSNYKYHYQNAGLNAPFDAYELDLSDLNNFSPERFKSWNGYCFPGQVG